MGLSIEVLRGTGQRVDFAYHLFGAYRKRLAMDAAGIELHAMKGYGGDRDWPDHHLQPLRHLLEHSDCDGWLSEWECEAIAPVMRAFRPPTGWPIWMTEQHAALTAVVLDVAEHGGVLRFR